MALLALASPATLRVNRLAPPASELGVTMRMERRLECGRATRTWAGAHDDFLVAASGIVAFLDDEREENDTDCRTAILRQRLIRQRRIARALIHQRGIEGNRLSQLARVIVFGLQWREHHILGTLGSHLDGKVDRFANDTAELPLDLILKIGGWREDLNQDGEYSLHHCLGVLVPLIAELGTTSEQRQGDGTPLADGVRGGRPRGAASQGP